MRAKSRTRLRKAHGLRLTALGNRSAAQGGYAQARDDSYYTQLLGRMQNRDRPWRSTR
jgi:hypothetical protein